MDRQEIIDLLEKMVKDAENIQGYAHRHSEAIIKARECFAIQIQLRGDQALTFLKQPKCKTCGDTKPETFIRWLSELREEDKLLGYGYIKRTTGQKQELYKMYLEDFKPCPDCQQPKASEFTKRVRTQPYDPKWKHTLIIQTEDRDEFCDRLDGAEAINKDLLAVLEYALVSLTVISMPRQDNNVATDAELLKIMGDSFRAAIAKAKK